MNALSTLSEMPLTKAECKTFANMAIEEILSGERNPIQIEIQLKALEETIKLIRENEQVKRCLQTEAEKYTEKTFQFQNAEISKMSRSNYDLSTCNDSIYNKLKSDIKEREAFLKALNSQVANPETGEIINPPVKTYTNYLQIKL
jgi:hypothetical protein